MTMNDDQRRRLSASMSLAARASAENRRCPKCGRASALSSLRHELPAPIIYLDRAAVYYLSRCRWCDYEQVWESGQWYLFPAASVPAEQVQ